MLILQTPTFSGSRCHNDRGWSVDSRGRGRSPVGADLQRRGRRSTPFPARCANSRESPSTPRPAPRQAADTASCSTRASWTSASGPSTARKMSASDMSAAARASTKPPSGPRLERTKDARFRSPRMSSRYFNEMTWRSAMASAFMTVPSPAASSAIALTALSTRSEIRIRRNYPSAGGQATSPSDGCGPNDGYLPCQTGGRFWAKAMAPSRASSLLKTGPHTSAMSAALSYAISSRINRLVPCTASGPLALISAARANAVSTTSAAGTTRLISPNSRARAADDRFAGQSHFECNL